MLVTFVTDLAYSNPFILIIISEYIPQSRESPHLLHLTGFLTTQTSWKMNGNLPQLEPDGIPAHEDSLECREGNKHQRNSQCRLTLGQWLLKINGLLTAWECILQKMICLSVRISSTQLKFKKKKKLLKRLKKRILSIKAEYSWGRGGTRPAVTQENPVICTFDQLPSPSECRGTISWDMVI